MWHAINPADEDLAPDAEDVSVKVPTMMTTADIALAKTLNIKKYLNISRES